MKITQSQLRQIIREEASRVLTEQKDFDDLAQHEAESKNKKGKKLEDMLERAADYANNNVAVGDPVSDDDALRKTYDLNTALCNIIISAGRALVARDSGNEEVLKIQLGYIDSELEDAQKQI